MRHRAAQGRSRPGRYDRVMGAALLAAILCAADAGAGAPSDSPTSNHFIVAISAVSWPALARSSWVDPDHPTASPAHFSRWSPAIELGYRRSISRIGAVEVGLGGSLGIAFAEASGATPVKINGMPSSVTEGITSRYLFLTGNLRVQRLAGPFRPFVEGGFGYYIEDVSVQLSEGLVTSALFRSETVGGWVGAGFDYLVARWTNSECGFALAARVHIVGFGGPSPNQTSGGSIGGPIFELSPSFVFAWGR